MDGNKRPARVGLVRCAAGEGEAARAIELLLDDAAEAGAVYERRADAERPVEFARGAAGGGETGFDGTGFDAVILGLDGTDARFGDVLDSLSAGTSVYAVCVCVGCPAEEALGCLHALEEACDQRGLAWAGGVAVGHAQVVSAFERSPRLGFWRRPVSEALDLMLLAVRCGSDAGLAAVRPGPLRRAYARLLLRRR